MTEALLTEISNFSNIGIYHINNLLLIYFLTAAYLIIGGAKKSRPFKSGKKSLWVFHRKLSALAMSYFGIYVFFIYLSKVFMWVIGINKA